MRHLLSGTVAGLLVLVFSAAASAQGYGSSYYGPSYQSPPVVRYQQCDPYVQPSYYGYSQPSSGGSFNYSTPSFGFGLNVNPSYGSNFGINSQPSYAPNYYPTRPVTPWHSHHHHHHHRSNVTSVGPANGTLA
ncbi:MAG: hypothetical protein HYX68_15345 [Planctomycetes bacterium]|nr:hypothetical protein [Planctomycetota bacterium]